MNLWIKIAFLAIMLLGNVGIYGQNKAELEKKRDELIEQIKYTNSLIQATRTRTKLTQNQVKILAEQINLREE